MGLAACVLSEHVRVACATLQAVLMEDFDPMQPELWEQMSGAVVLSGACGSFKVCKI